MCEKHVDETSTSDAARATDDADAIDVAIVDALRAQKNRQTGAASLCKLVNSIN